MKVDLRSYGLEPPERGKTGRAGQAADAAAASRSSDTADQAQLSNQSRVRSLEAQVMALPEVRQPKVEALQQAIAKKEYAASSAQVADAIVRDKTGKSPSR
jgi:flagellar biosynthesis anti-sigma factor FlgM